MTLGTALRNRKKMGWALAAGAAAAALVWPLGSSGNADLSDAVQGGRTAGEATAFATGRNAFSMPFPTLDVAERARFAVGNSFFRRNWVEAPASTTARDGLGPHFIARSCGGCHVQDGRGAPPEVRKGEHEAPVALLMRLSIPGTGAHGGVVPDPVYGDQFNNAAVQGVQPEGQVRIRTQTLRGRFADGTPYTLQEPLNNNGENVRAITYPLDFYLPDYDMAIDTKGVATQQGRLRIKMLKRLFADLGRTTTIELPRTKDECAALVARLTSNR